MSRLLLFVGLAVLAASILSPATAADDDMLKIHVVAHTHDDTGWLRSVDDYYSYEVEYILDTVVDCLLANPDRKFIYVEQAFFTRWWNEQPESRREQTKKLVQNGQLEFILGGWCMNDEATTHYDQIVSQMTEGHDFLLKTFGVKPKIGWHIDPFGASSVTPSLWAMTGFDAFVINRIDYRLKESLMNDKELEFVWRGSKSLGASTDMFTHILGWHYCTPDGFDWEHGISQDLPSGDGPPVVITQSPSPITPVNVQTIADNFVNMAKGRADNFVTKNVMIPFGCDFNFQNAFMKFINMDKIIAYVNANPDRYGATVQYSTLTDYFDDVHAAEETWGVRTTDFFPYADNNQSYWTGYFSSRPAIKEMVRRTGAYQRTAEVIHAAASIENVVEDEDKAMEALEDIRHATSVAQHHDAVTGTERDYVAYDYQRRLAYGAHKTVDSNNDLIKSLSGREGVKAFDVAAPETDTEHPYKIDVAGEKEFDVTVFNALGWTREEIFRLPLGEVADDVNDVVVTDPNGNKIDAQLAEDWEVRSGSCPAKDTSGKVVYFPVQVPPAGYATYRVSLTSSFAAAPVLELSADVDSDDVVLENSHLLATIDGKTKLLSSIVNKEEDLSFKVTQDFVQYIPVGPGVQQSGAYIFRPAASDNSEVIDSPSVEVQSGPCVTEVRQIYKQTVKGASSNITHIIRVFHQDSLHAKALHTITFAGPLQVDDGAQSGREVNIRYTTDVESGTTFFTDDNGMEMQTRTRNLAGRPGDADAGVALAGNFYPVVSRAYVKDDKRQFTVLTDAAHAGSSLAEGSIELMVHRRLLTDDGRGVGQALDDTNTTSPRFSALFESASGSAAMHRVLANYIENPLSGFVFAPSKSKETYSILQADLPENIHLATFRVSPHNAKEYYLRLMHIFEVDEDATLSKPVSLDLNDYFNNLASVEERTLTMNELAKDNVRPQWNTRSADGADTEVGPVVEDGSTTLTISPMQIRSFIVTFN